MNRILIKPDCFIEDKCFIKKRLLAELENLEVDFISGNDEEDLVKFEKCNIYFGNDFDEKWLTISKNLYWIIVEHGNENELVTNSILGSNVLITSYSTFHNPLDYLLELMKLYFERLLGMHLKYVEIENVRAMVKRYFNETRIQNIMSNKCLNADELKKDINSGRYN